MSEASIKWDFKLTVDEIVQLLLVAIVCLCVMLTVEIMHQRLLSGREVIELAPVRIMDVMERTINFECEVLIADVDIERVKDLVLHFQLAAVDSQFRFKCVHH